MRFPALKYGSKHIQTEYDPDQRDQNVYRPFQFGIFRRGGDAQGQSDRCQQNDKLPSPEINPAQQVTRHSGFHQSLQRIINPEKNAVTYKCKNHCIGV